MFPRSCVLALLVSFTLTGQTAVPAVEAPRVSYQLEAGDQIEVRFFNNPELSDKVEIRPDGKIAMPLVGQVRAAGRTVEGLTAEVELLYKDIVRQPQVTVQVRGYAGRKFIVGGDVQRPGVFALYGGQTILGAVMEAGGWRPTSKRDAVILIRRSPSGAPEMREIALRAPGGQQFPPAALMEIQPYDMILVAESGVARANRFVEQYMTKMLPFTLSGGFSYILGGNFIR